MNNNEENVKIDIMRDEKNKIAGAKAKGDIRNGDVDNALLMAFSDDMNKSIDKLNQSSNRLEKLTIDLKSWNIGLFILTIILCVLTIYLIMMTSKL
jgi:hypothetical protein